MPDILHRVGIAGPTAPVHQALTTIDGLAHWWTTEAKGNAAQGGEVDFGFCRMAVTEARPDTMVRWTCIGGPPEWVGTTVTFTLKQEAAQTVVLFTHAGWKEPVEFMHHCSTKWATFLLGLRDWVERGQGHPSPYDVKIHPGD